MIPMTFSVMKSKSTKHSGIGTFKGNGSISRHWIFDSSIGFSNLTDTFRGGSDAASPAVSLFQSSEGLETAPGQRVMNVAKEWAAAWKADTHTSAVWQANDVVYSGYKTEDQSARSNP